MQAELQQYLNTKNINSLFISIVENLLIEKPANPIAFIIEFLYKQYPDQSKPALDSIFPHGASAESKAVAKSESKASVAASKKDVSCMTLPAQLRHLIQCNIPLLYLDQGGQRRGRRRGRRGGHARGGAA